MSSIQVSDQTFIAAPPESVAESLGVVSKWRRWWPDLRIAVREDRGEKGIRWTVAGPLTGTMEVWLEPELDGTIVHYFLHAEPTGAGPAELAKLDLGALIRARRVAGKVMAFETKRELEAGRPAGEAPTPRRSPA
ncbi:polyketide cyclase / dehydrase and lipid transport [Rhodococcus sp. NPDC058514]|uniref:polyketide cyclase / dehydrase and lipid transport n=1 Tax=unclassified Rhodococcus (in: high G+C Gram-positive bacteria) TaxID=192944 RepID=UPI00364C0F4B